MRLTMKGTRTRQEFDSLTMNSPDLPCVLDRAGGSSIHTNIEVEGRLCSK